MTVSVFNDRQRLAVIEQIIMEMKFNGEHGYKLNVLKSLAKDIRSRMSEMKTQALQTLEKKMARVIEGKTEVGFDRRDLAHLAIYVVGFWPTIRAALVDSAKEKLLEETGAHDGWKAKQT